MHRFFLPDETATLEFGAALSTILAIGDVIALKGDLGAGKTTLTRGVLQALCGDIEVPSPTYTLVQTYETPAFLLWHFDLYRLESSEDLEELAWDETAEGVALIEWPDRAGGRLPLWRLDLTLVPETEGRTAVLEPQGEDWQKRLNGDSFRFPRSRD
ncbi:MAG: tRNA (adenosine(37)-N6)-threonylcarbamoyltransferase complex ATPase subunit type 1 TsaE [Pseudomonadota bacterium]